MATLVGLLGGIAPESTIDYYRQIIALFREKDTEGRHPTLLIDSIDLKLTLRLLGERRYDELADLLTREVARLERAGATFGAIASNTVHVVFDEVAHRSTLPLLNIVEAAAAAASRAGLRRPALFGTRFLMSDPLYPRVFGRAGLEVVLPPAAEQDTIHRRYMEELVAGVFRPATRDELVAIAERMRDRHGADGLVLGGTELPLVLRGATIEGLPFLDTTRLHVEAIVERLRSAA
jgi:aspartate racemase